MPFPGLSQIDIPSDTIINYMVQNSKGKIPALTHSGAANSKYFEKFPVRPFSQPQIDTFPLKPEEDFDRKALLAALNAYISQKMAAKDLDGSSSVSRTKESTPYTSRLKLKFPQIDHLDGMVSKENTGDFDMKSPFPRRPVYGLVPSSVQSDLRVPLTPVDEILIQDVLRDLKKHHVDVDKLSPLELDEMADIIADAIQGVDTDEEKKNAAGKVEGEKTEKGMDAEGKDDYEMGLMSEGYHMQDERAQDENTRIKEEGNHLNTEQFDFVNENMATSPKETFPKDPFKIERKKSEDLDLSLSSSEEVKTGIENVKSKTFSRELVAQKKAGSEPSSKERTELHQWIMNTLIQNENTYEETEEKMGEDLQLDAKSSKEEEYGYIVTEKDSLSEEKGLELIKEVAGLLKLQMTAFADIKRRTHMGSAPVQCLWPED
ncbi:Receptor-type tyrosine-protein phosphatase N2 [Varanus komodoensis]|nr:Receptor-type tyrosine-protein phosphatase N2 [Varanus komodoensis]